MQDIYVDDIGKGFPLVLLHGFLGSSIMWKPQIEYLKKNYRVIAPDLPGFGKSNNIKACNSIKCMAETILTSLKKKTNRKILSTWSFNGRNDCTGNRENFRRTNI